MTGWIRHRCAADDGLLQGDKLLNIVTIGNRFMLRYVY